MSMQRLMSVCLLIQSARRSFAMANPEVNLCFICDKRLIESDSDSVVVKERGVQTSQIEFFSLINRHGTTLFFSFFYVVRYISMRHMKVITYFFRSVALWHYLTSRCCLYLCKKQREFRKNYKIGEFFYFFGKYVQLFVTVPSIQDGGSSGPTPRSKRFFVKTQTLTTYKKVTTTPPFLWQNTPLTGLLGSAAKLFLNIILQR